MPGQRALATLTKRCIFESSSRLSFKWLPHKAMTQLPFVFSSRKEFSVASKANASPRSAPPEKPPGSGNNISKLVLGSVAVGAAIMAVYQSGYINQYHVKEDNSSAESSKVITNDNDSRTLQHSEDQVATQYNPNENEPNLDHVERESNAHSEVPYVQDQHDREGESHAVGEPGATLTSVVNTIPVTEKESPYSSSSDHQNGDSETSKKQNSLDIEKLEVTIVHPTSNSESTDVTESTLVSEEQEKVADSLHLKSNDIPKEVGIRIEASNPLSDAYFLGGNDGDHSDTSLNSGVLYGSEPVLKGKELLEMKKEDGKDMDLSQDARVILDMIEAIHAAEKRQAELDAHVYTKEKRLLKEKYQKELKDSRARELMYAEEAALLDKELNMERAKAMSTINTLKEKAEEDLKMELQRMEEEAQLELKKARELAKAELAAAIANEKSSLIEKMAEANLHINALCMAFYARSEEARQSHSAHKLALGALALEDALGKGLPIQREIDALYTSLDGIDQDSLLYLALSSLPRETLNQGTYTLLHLNQKFDALKEMLRHFSLIPSGGGGILTHAVAHIASSIKVKENNPPEDGIESVIRKVERFLAEGKLAEAADVLEGTVSGTRAEEVIADWVKQARNRAIMEQALSLLQSYATSISLS